jgi:spore maturation protein CgeB
VRALVVEPGPSFSVADVHHGIMSGLEQNGVTAVPHDLGDWMQFCTLAHMKRGRKWIPAFEYEDACRMAAYTIKAACWDAVPDVVIIVSSFFIPPDIYMNLRERGRHVVLWLTESPYEDERQVAMARHADTVITNDPTNLDLFRKQNPRTFHIPHGYDPNIHHDIGRSDKHPFSFVGTGYPSRVEFFEKVDWPCDPLFAGNWKQVGDDSPLLPFLADERGQCIDNTDTADLYRSSVTSANLYRKEAMSDDDIEGWAIGPREVELAMCGLWFAREPRSEGDQLFKRLPKFTEPGELSDQLRWALDHPDARRDAITQAKAAVADRTFKNNIAHLLKIIGL